MVCQLGCVNIGSVMVKFFKGLRNLSMQPHPTGRGQLFGQGILYQSVGELVATHSLGEFLDDPGRQGFFQSIQQPVF